MTFPGVVTGVTTRLAALRVAAHVALGTALSECQLGPAVGAGAEELLLHVVPLGGQPPFPLAQEILLNPLLLLHPLLDGDADRVGDREHLAGSKAHDPIGGNTAQLPIDLAHRNPGAETE